MNEELIDSAWRVLPNEFKEEVKKRYKGCLFTANRYAKVEADLLEEFFGIHNLTSDAEGEEMLTISAKQVEQWLDEAEAEIHKSTNGMYSSGYWNGKKEVYKKLLGPKCLPDEEPQPTEPKYHIGQRVRHIPTRLVDVIDGISQAAPYIYHFKHMVDPINGQGIFESDLEPYTEPEEYVNLSQNIVDCDKQFDNILKDSFSKERRLNIAAMAMQGLLANPNNNASLRKTIADALNCADALLHEVEKGGSK